MDLKDFKIRNTRPEEADIVIDILETGAKWLHANNIKQWPLGMFSSAEGRRDIVEGIDGERCFMIDYCSPDDSSGTPILAGLFVLNADDPFDGELWSDVEDWKDALYLHRLIFQEPFRGAGLTGKVIEFAEDKVKESGRHYLRLDCIAHSESLRRFYREKCRGRGKGGLLELSTRWNPERQLEFARFETRVVP
ncbi:hypothetical protein BGX34_009180 [Mortierella sp. NVP85]|nr:hypothetical protein BGX34_009180 [Mortierella sp. NVP85]